MSTTIYTKFSNDRNDEFNICTDIIQEDSGLKFIRKRAYSETSQPHIDHIYDMYQKLNILYRDTSIKINKCSKIDKDIKFEYLNGKTLEEYLDDLMIQEKYHEMLKIMEQFFDEVKSRCKERFFVTKEFNEIFGNASSLTETLGASVSNIDMLFSNVILNDGWNIIDYEWTFDFIIPVNYIIYRSLFYYIRDEKRKKILDLGLFKIFGISDRELSIFEKMENKFQNYLIKGNVPLRDIAELIKKPIFDRESLLREIANESKNKYLKVYRDSGNGFSEDDTFVQPLISNNKYIIPIKSGTKSIRIDPSEEAGICYIWGGTIYSESFYPCNFITNGMEISHNTFLFDHKDPNIIFTNIKQDANKLSINICYEEISDDLIDLFINLIKQKNTDIENIVKAKEVEINNALKAKDIISNKYQNLCQELNNLNDKYNNLKNEKESLDHNLYIALRDYDIISKSFLWRITKPLRNILDGIKRLINKSERLYDLLWFIKSTLRQGIKHTQCQYSQIRQDRKKAHIQHMLDFFGPKEYYENESSNISDKNIKFSILVPIYNTPELFLCQMIESVLSQTYCNFELCLADGSDSENKKVGKLCKRFARLDKRIKYKKLRENKGIADNTNACIAMASGQYIALFDHDDFLHPSALKEVADVIVRQKADFIYTDETTFHFDPADAYNFHYKPDFSPDTLRSHNYICHFSVFSHKLLKKVGGFRKGFDGSQDYDMILRLTEKAQHIIHIPKVLYYWRAHANSVAEGIGAKTYAVEAGKYALREHLKRCGLEGEVLDARVPSRYRIKYTIKDKKMVSILIPNRDHKEDLKKCVDSILLKTTYSNYEIIIIENNSEQKEIFQYYQEISNYSNIKVVTWEGDFNYSAINNFGYSFAQGEYILLLNNDVEVITPDWLQEMIMFVQRKDVGIVGAKLLYPDNTIQHAGIILGMGGIAGHPFRLLDREAYGYTCRLIFAQNLTCVTGACMMTKREIYNEMLGLDEDYAVAFNDVDFCMRVREKGYLVVFTPYAELYHYESKSRGAEDTKEKQQRFNKEIYRFANQWKKELEKGDPYYNPNLTLMRTDFTPMLDGEVIPYKTYFQPDFINSLEI